MIRKSLCVGLLIAGCANLDDASAPVGDGETLTVVRLRGAEAPEVSTIPIGATRGGDGVTRIAQAASQDTACAGASLWLYAGTNRSGSRACFTGTGFASLSDLCLNSSSLCSGGICRPICLQTWAGAVRSYWAGSASSTLLQRYTGSPATTAPTCTEYALTFRQQNTALACAQSATHVWLGSDPAHEIFGYATTVPASDPNPADIRLSVGSLASATVSVTSSSGTTATVTGETPITLTATSDNPGGVRSLTVSYSATFPCRTSSGGTITYTSRIAFPDLGSSDALTAGAATSTRRTVTRSLSLLPDPRLGQDSLYHLAVLSRSCPAGSTYFGGTYTFVATATSYGGVTTTTPIATVNVNY